MPSQILLDRPRQLHDFFSDVAAGQIAQSWSKTGVVNLKSESYPDKPRPQIPPPFVRMRAFSNYFAGPRPCWTTYTAQMRFRLKITHVMRHKVLCTGRAQLLNKTYETALGPRFGPVPFYLLNAAQSSVA